MGILERGLSLVLNQCQDLEKHFRTPLGTVQRVVGDPQPLIAKFQLAATRASLVPVELDILLVLVPPSWGQHCYILYRS